MTDKCFWIEASEDIETHPDLEEVHDELRGPGGKIYNLYRAFSLRPATLAPAVRHYRAVLQGEENTLGKWLLEMIATYVAIRTNCGYARAHHGANFLHLLGDPARGAAMLQAMEHDDLLDEIFSPREAVILAFARKLTASPEAMDESDLAPLRAHGLTDGEILEVVQTCATFAYWTRLINGLGISLAGEPGIGLYDS